MPKKQNDNYEESIRLGLLKLEGKLDKSWPELDKQLGNKPDGTRQMTKNYRRKTGILQGKYQSGRERILVISDLHIPEHQEELILDIIRANKDVHKIFLNGDIIDCKAVSAWHDSEITILDHELITAHRLLVKIREITNAHIMLIKGNHEQRVNTHYARNAKALGSAVVETEILYKLMTGFTIKYEKSRQRIKYEAIENVFYADARSYLYGDLLLNHPSTFSKNYMQTSQRIWEGKLKDKYPMARVVVVGHSHQLGMAFIEDDVLLMECGCTCEPARYADNDDRPYRVQQYGYVYLEMQNEVVDKETIKLVNLGNDNKYHKDHNVPVNFVSFDDGDDDIEDEI